MQWIWLLPSLGYGVYLYLSSGQISGLIFAAFSVLALVAGGLLTGRRETIDLKAPVHFNGSTDARWRVAIGNRVLPRFEWLWKNDWVGRVYQDLEQQNQNHNARIRLQSRLSGNLATASPGFSGWLGFSGSNEISVDLANEGAHALIVGSTGAGKSQLLTTWLVSLCQRFAPDQLHLWLMDLKGGATFGPASELPWVAEFCTDIDADPHDLLADLLAELERRERLCANAAVSRMDDLQDSQRPPRILLVVDEAQHLLTNPNSHGPLINLAARGRSLGIHLILTVQSLGSVPRMLMANLGLKLAVGKTDLVDLAQLGFQRSSAPIGAQDPEVAGVPNVVPETWGKGILVSPLRQLNFAFPSNGKVGFGALKAATANPKENVFLTDTEPFVQQMAPISSESVVIPRNTFDFSIGLEKRPQLTAENHIV